MTTAHVVMAEKTSPMYFCVPYPVAVFSTSKAAKSFVDEKNKRATSLQYYVRKAKLIEYKEVEK